MKKLLVFSVVFVLLTSLFLPASASAGEVNTKKEVINQPTSIVQDKLDLLHKEKSPEYFKQNSHLYDQYINLDSNKNEFYLNEKANGELDLKTRKILDDLINSSNKAMKEMNIDASFSGTDVVVEFQDPQLEIGLEEPDYQTLAYKEGVTKLKAHWWGLSFYVKKSHLNAAGTGLTIGGIWVPVPLLNQVLATLGVVAGLAPGGVIFDRVHISPVLFNNVRWQ